MKVDQYRIQKATEYSFLVPAGMDLEEFGEPEKGYLVAFYPYALEQQEVDLETIVTGSELASAIEDLDKNRLAVVLSIPVPDAVEANEDGID